MNVSVVIPLFNKGRYIARAVDSVLAQTYTDFELIVVDDGSTDGSGEIVGRYDDRRVRLVTQENRGECAARNRGVAEAGTEWVAFLDADDEWLPRFLERAMAMLEANPTACAVFTNVKNAQSGTRLLRKPAVVGIVPDYLRFFVDNDGLGMTSSSVVIRKESLLRAGGFPEGVRHGGDVGTWPRVAWTGDVAYVPEVLALVHGEAEGRVMRDGAKAVSNAHEAAVASYHLWKQQGRIPKRHMESSLRFLHFMFLRHARMLTDAGQNASARAVLRSRCRPGLCGRRRYWRAYVRTLVPRRVLEYRRFLMRLGRRIFGEGPL